MTPQRRKSKEDAVRFAAGTEWIDISWPLAAGMAVWPGDPPFKIGRCATIAAGDGANVSRLDMGAHSGTHMDAPVHFLDGGAGIEALPLDAVLGPARVVEIADPVAIRAGELAMHGVAAGERILFKTLNSSSRWSTQDFREDFVHIAPDAAAHLAAARVRTVGIDYLSVGGFRAGGIETHRILLEAGIWIIEGLDLSRVRPGLHWLACLPLRVTGSDGAPARAVVRPLDSAGPSAAAAG